MSGTYLNIFEIERFAIHDGPGIRTAVFLKGCPLRCAWCANPESQAFEPELMWLKKKCTGCGTCAKACPNGVIMMRAAAPVFDRGLCSTCGACAKACPGGALRIAGNSMSVSEILAVALRDKAYYESSGGGVTVTGGEPFAQYDGLLALLAACKRAGLHTAVETCGDVPPARFADSFALTDLYLFDLKHSDGEKLRAMAGGNPGRILENFNAVTAYNADKVIVRVPVIPGFNFDELSIRAIFDIARSRGVKQVHLLPYHTLGSGKYAACGKTAQMDQVQSLKKEDLEPFRESGGQSGLAVTIGG